MVTNYGVGGGLQNGSGGASEVLPPQKKGAEEVLAIGLLIGEWKKCPPFKKKRGGGREKIYPVLRGGGRKKF